MDSGTKATTSQDCSGDGGPATTARPIDLSESQRLGSLVTAAPVIFDCGEEGSQTCSPSEVPQLSAAGRSGSIRCHHQREGRSTHTDIAASRIIASAVLGY